MAAVPENLKEMAAGLAKYQYVSPNLSMFEKAGLNQFWDTVAQYYPTWLAPNLLTLAGFLCSVVGAVVVFVWSPDFLGTVPSSGYLAIALLFWLYQTLDGTNPCPPMSTPQCTDL